MSITKIVITGGPCAGKTTGLSRIEEEFSNRGYTVLFVSEVATELIKNAQESQNGYVKVRMIRPNQVNSMSVILSMIGDYGFHMKQITLLEEQKEEARFELVICGDIMNEEMKKLIYQLSKESKDFEVL